MADPSKEPVARGTVLVAEDQPMILDMILGTVRALGYETLSASSPAKLLELAQKHPGKIVALLTDVVMPDMDGPALAQAVLALHPQTKVLYMSGYPERLMDADGKLQPGVEMLPKPFSRMALGAKLEAMLKN